MPIVPVSVVPAWFTWVSHINRKFQGSRIAQAWRGTFPFVIMTDAEIDTFDRVGRRLMVIVINYVCRNNGSYPRSD